MRRLEETEKFNLNEKPDFYPAYHTEQQFDFIKLNMKI